MLKNKFGNSIFKTCVALLLITLTFLTIGTAKAEESESEKALGGAAVLVGFAPHYVAPGVKLVSVEKVSQSTVQYTYVLEQVDRNSPELKNISQNLKNALIEDLKKKDEVQILRDNKVSLVFIFKDIKNVQLFRVTLNHGEY